ncbi:MAG: nucleoside hydrolase [Actinomycetota bacterium]
MSRPVLIIDTDTASDDAVALIMALRSPAVEVAAVTTVAGNCPVDQATRNALYTAQLCGSDVPVHRGADRPLLVPAAYATWFHGEDGLGDQGYPPPDRAPDQMAGVPALIEAIRANPGCVLVTLGPLTNVALAVTQDPGLVELVDRCVVMGGNANRVGNVTPAAEFNLWFDPHAAAVVFGSGLPIEMAGWELCRASAGLDAGEQAEIRSLDTELGHFALDCNATAIRAIREQSGADTLELPDPVAMAVALDRAGVVRRASRHHVAIETQSPLTRGMSVVDSLDVTGQPANVDVVWEIDIARFKAMVVDALR